MVSNPVEVATRSLRSVSDETGFAPVTFTRLARALDYQGFEELRDEIRDKLSRRINRFADRAGQLQVEHGRGSNGFFAAHAAACIDNIEALLAQIKEETLSEVVDRLYAAREVVVFGALGSTGLAEYLVYMAEFCTGNWRLASRMGSSIGAALGHLDTRDAMILITKPPFANQALNAARLAHQQGVYVVVITDTPSCPALRSCSASLMVPTGSPHFYSSYVASTVLVEALIGMLVSRAGPGAQDRISRIEESNRRLKIVSDG